MTELLDLSARALAKEIRKGGISARAATQTTLARIGAVNPLLNCFCLVLGDEALAAAERADAARAAGAPLGLLHGVPIAIKDFTPTKGHRTTRGSYVFEDWVADRDPVIVARLKAAGAIIVGKTTTPEFAYDSFTQSPLWGETRNPWDLGRTPGGSSGGSAAAVAARCVPLAEGTDMGGSVRIPASFCGLVGLKPSLGRIPMDIVGTVFDSISHFGPLARSVDDAALFMDVTAGPSAADIQSLPRETQALSSLPADPRAWRVALSIDLGYYAVDGEVEKAVRTAGDALAALGAAVEEVELGWSRAVNDAWFAYWGVFLAAAFGAHLDAHRERMDPNVVALIEAGSAMSAVDFKRLEWVRTAQWQKLAGVLAEHHVLLCPTMSEPAPPLGGSDSDWGHEDAAGLYHGLDMTCPFNFVAQCPVLSLPVGFSDAGLPVGAQIAGRRFEDRAVLEVGRRLPAELGLEVRRPPALEAALS